MNCTLIAQQGNAPALQLVVRDSTGAPILGATVQATIRDASGAAVAGQTWPATLAALAGDITGTYTAQLDALVALVGGITYKAAFVITIDAVPTTYIYDLYVAPPGPPPALASSPASPVYQQISLLQRLHEAENAYHAMMTGQNVVTVKDQNGEEVTFSLANRASLAQYIYSLQRQLRIGCGGPAEVAFIDRRFYPALWNDRRNRGGGI